MSLSAFPAAAAAGVPQTSLLESAPTPFIAFSDRVVLRLHGEAVAVSSITLNVMNVTRDSEWAVTDKYKVVKASEFGPGESPTRWLVDVHDLTPKTLYRFAIVMDDVAGAPSEPVKTLDSGKGVGVNRAWQCGRHVGHLEGVAESQARHAAQLKVHLAQQQAQHSRALDKVTKDFTESQKQVKELTDRLTKAEELANIAGDVWSQSETETRELQSRLCEAEDRVVAAEVAVIEKVVAVKESEASTLSLEALTLQVDEADREIKRLHDENMQLSNENLRLQALLESTRDFRSACDAELQARYDTLDLRYRKAVSTLQDLEKVSMLQSEDAADTVRSLQDQLIRYSSTSSENLWQTAQYLNTEADKATEHAKVLSIELELVKAELETMKNGSASHGASHVDPVELLALKDEVARLQTDNSSLVEQLMAAKEDAQQKRIELAKFQQDWKASQAASRLRSGASPVDLASKAKIDEQARIIEELRAMLASRPVPPPIVVDNSAEVRRLTEQVQLLEEQVTEATEAVNQAMSEAGNLRGELADKETIIQSVRRERDEFKAALDARRSPVSTAVTSPAAASISGVSAFSPVGTGTPLIASSPQVPVSGRAAKVKRDIDQAMGYFVESVDSAIAAFKELFEMGFSTDVILDAIINHPHKVVLAEHCAHVPDSMERLLAMRGTIRDELNERVLRRYFESHPETAKNVSQCIIGYYELLSLGFEDRQVREAIVEFPQCAPEALTLRADRCMANSAHKPG